MSDTFLGNIRSEDGRVRTSILYGTGRVLSFDLEPEVAADLGHALIAAAEPSVWVRLHDVWRNRRGVS